MTGKTSELIALLSDGRSRTVPEIHAVIGPCRLNSRAAEARARLRAQGRDLVCARTPGLSGPGAYSYRIVDGSLTEGDHGSPGTHVWPGLGCQLAAPSVSDSLTFSGPEPQSAVVAGPASMTTQLGPPGIPSPSGPGQLSFEVAA